MAVGCWNGWSPEFRCHGAVSSDPVVVRSATGLGMDSRRFRLGGFTRADGVVVDPNPDRRAIDSPLCFSGRGFARTAGGPGPSSRRCWPITPGRIEQRADCVVGQRRRAGVDRIGGDGGGASPVPYVALMLCRGQSWAWVVISAGTRSACQAGKSRRELDMNKVAESGAAGIMRPLSSTDAWTSRMVPARERVF